MTFTTFVDVADVARFSAPHLIVDCRSQLGNFSWGEQEYRRQHIDGAVFAHLEHHLSDPVVAGKTGRHPLPSPARLCEFFSALGITPDTQVFAYDQDNGAYAARLWWLLRWLGHERVAVINGGWRAWQAAQLPISCSIPTRERRLFVGVTRAEKVATAEGILARDKNTVLIDARSAARFAGREETIDPVAGHIPGARSFPFVDNVDADARILPINELHKRFAGLRDHAVISYCGSGVTASHNILAMVHAGFAEPQLYAGSWSEWICNPEHPIATGN